MAFELTCFETDRYIVARQLKAVENDIENAADEMKMIGVENVFDQRLSNVLTGEAQALQRIARKLEHLRQEVARARLRATRKASAKRQRQG
jgi:hypothetical protein